MTPPPLESFGRRIMVCGPSNSGKSTLAVALATRLGVPAIHLDQFQHLPNTDWVRRPEAEFQQLHDEAILGEAWVMDGNYSRLMPQRLARATGIILLGDNRWANFARYLRRTLFQKHRAGALGGDTDTLKWEMVRWILLVSPGNMVRYRRELPAAGLPFWESASMRELGELYSCWALPHGRGRRAG